MIIAGFDPGITGAAAAIRVGDMGAVELIDIIDLPTCDDGSNREIDVPALGAWLERVQPDIAYVENVTPMPSLRGNRSMGATSAFRFGGAVFALRATLKAYSIPVVLKTPQTWKAAMGLRGSDKEKSRRMAIARLPVAEPFLKRKLDHNRADSVLLALYGSTNIT
jgi:crossover junction endodeoxyribonuclease RuvC